MAEAREYVHIDINIRNKRKIKLQFYFIIVDKIYTENRLHLDERN